MTNTPASPSSPSRLHAAIQRLGQGRADDAVRIMRIALQQEPHSAVLHHNLGYMLSKARDHVGALHHFQRAAELDPGLAEACLGCAQAALALGRTDTALGWYRRAVALRPQDPRAHYNLANLYKAVASYAQAGVHYRRAVELDPQAKEALNNLGVLALQTGAYDQAVAWLRKALDVDPKHVRSLYNLSLALKRLGKADQALAPLERALALEPDDPQALALRVSLLQQLCAWQDLAAADIRLESLTRQQLANNLRPAETPFLSFTRTQNPQRNLQVARSWADEIIAKTGTRGLIRRHAARNAPKDKIVVGYLSEQFRDAATAHLINALFKQHDRDCFQINAYSLGRDDHGAFRRHIIGSVDRFIDLRGVTDQAAANTIHEHGVDILVDLIGWMHGHRITIPALRPAPVQVNYLGYPGTLGAGFMDYILADRTVIPPEQQCFYAEKVVYLPHCYQVTDPCPQVSDLGLSRLDCGLPPDGTVFCSFCTDYKIEKPVFEAWLQILRAVPGSVLWLLVRTAATASNLRQAALHAGIDPARLVFAQPLPKDQHLERLRLADLALDTATVNGHTTTTDALWSGVPVLTLQGGHFASRVASSLLRAMGLERLVMGGLQEYIDFAIHLGQDSRRLASLKEKVRLQRHQSPLFDLQGFTRGLETAFRTMWEIHLRGDPPRGFDVADS